MKCVCYQCGKKFRKKPSDQAPKGRPWKRAFCNRGCYNRWRADRHLVFQARWLRFQREVWGTTPFGRRQPSGTREYGRKFEVLARDEYLPKEGFSDISDLSAMSNQFFIDFVATYRRRRVLVDATVKLKAYIPEKVRLARALRMPLFIMHVAPGRAGLYYLNEVPEGLVVSRVPARFIRRYHP